MTGPQSKCPVQQTTPGLAPNDTIEQTTASDSDETYTAPDASFMCSYGSASSQDILLKTSESANTSNSLGFSNSKCFSGDAPFSAWTSGKRNLHRKSGSANSKDKGKNKLPQKSPALYRSKTCVDGSKSSKVSQNYVFEHHQNWRKYMEQYRMCHSSITGGATVSTPSEDDDIQTDNFAEVPDFMDKTRKCGTDFVERVCALKQRSHQNSKAVRSSPSPNHVATTIVTTGQQNTTTTSASRLNSINLAPVRNEVSASGTRCGGGVGGDDLTDIPRESPKQYSPSPSPAKQQQYTTKKFSSSHSNQFMNLSSPRLGFTGPSIYTGSAIRMPFNVGVVMPPQLLTGRSHGNDSQRRTFNGARPRSATVISSTTVPLSLTLGGSVDRVVTQENLYRKYRNGLTSSQPGCLQAAASNSL